VSKAEVFYARERSLSEGDLPVWDYVVEQGDGLVVLAGYCAGWDEYTLDELNKKHGKYYGKSLFDQQESRRKWQQKYHLDGHSTREYAQLCHREYRLDQELSITPLKASRPCEVCLEPATFLVEFVGGQPQFHLCADHATRECVDLLLPSEVAPQRIVFY
jgi:hypothetical protein